jgi:hypothetical protein
LMEMEEEKMAENLIKMRKLCFRQPRNDSQSRHESWGLAATLNISRAAIKVEERFICKS